ncbi:MAG TPA: hypothetical protein VIU29_03765 [Candidatus Deferrimicrobiaceae bacterium]
MKAILILVAAALSTAASPAAFAGELYGTVMEGGKPVKAGTKIEVKCAGGSYSAQTDKDGAYRLFVPEQGKCTLTVKSGAASPSMTIHSFEDSARFVLSIEKVDGKPVLRGK